MARGSWCMFMLCTPKQINKKSFNKKKWVKTCNFLSSFSGRNPDPRLACPDRKPPDGCADLEHGAPKRPGGQNMHLNTEQRKSIRNKKVTQEPDPNKYSLRHSNFAHCAFAQPLHFWNYVAFAHCAANFQGQKENLIVSQISGGTQTLKNKSQTAQNEKVGFFKKCQFDCKKTIESQDFFENLMKRGSC